MKKVKIMLTAVTVLAVVGGALAFKAQKFSNFCVYTADAPGACAATSINSITTPSEDAQSFVTTRLKNGLGQCPALPSDCEIKAFVDGE